MNLSLEDNMTKLVLLVVVGVVCLLVINMKQKQLGKNVSVLLSVLVIGVCGYFGYVVLNEPEPVHVEENVFNELQSPIVENFQNNEVVDDAEEDGQEVEQEVEEEVESNNENVNAAVNVNNAPSNNNLNSSDLLPGAENANNALNKNAPFTPGSVLNSSLLSAGHLIGVNTQGCSMRNANRGLRSEPPNPQTQVSPWLQTTICPDLYRKPLDGEICD